MRLLSPDTRRNPTICGRAVPVGATVLCYISVWVWHKHCCLLHDRALPTGATPTRGLWEPLLRQVIVLLRESKQHPQEPKWVDITHRSALSW
jgi:hypothetical protein